MKMLTDRFKVKTYVLAEETVCKSQKEISNYHTEMSKKYPGDIEIVVREIYKE